MQINRSETYPRLATALTITFLLCGILLVLALLSRVSGHLVEFETEIQGEKILTGAEGAELVLTRAIEREWAGLAAIAGSSASGDIASMRRRLIAAATATGSVSWAGFANSDGEIVAATQGIGEGIDLGGAGWFRFGLAVDTLEHTSFAPFEAEDAFLQLTRPVRDADNTVVGVMVFQLSQSWVTGLLRETADRFGIDLLLVDGADNVIVDARFDPNLPVPSSVLRTQPGQRILRISDAGGPEGELIFATMPAIASDEMPFFEGRLIAFAPAGMAGGTFASFTQHMLFWIVGALAMATLVPILLVAHFIRPIEKLARTAEALADGKLEFPEERCYTREAAIFSASLARIQTQLRLQATMERVSEAEPRDASSVHEVTPLNSPLIERRSTRIA